MTWQLAAEAEWGMRKINRNDKNCLFINCKLHLYTEFHLNWIKHASYNVLFLAPIQLNEIKYLGCCIPELWFSPRPQPGSRAGLVKYWNTNPCHHTWVGGWLLRGDERETFCLSMFYLLPLDKNHYKYLVSFSCTCFSWVAKIFPVSKNVSRL